MEINNARGEGFSYPVRIIKSPVPSEPNVDYANAPSVLQHPITSVSELKKLESQGEQVPISDEQLIRAIDRALKAVQGPYTSLEFNVHEKTKQLMVKVLDKETGKVIREVPPEKNLDLIAKIWEMAGLFIDEKR